MTHESSPPYSTSSNSGVILEFDEECGAYLSPCIPQQRRTVLSTEHAKKINIPTVYSVSDGSIRQPERLLKPTKSDFILSGSSGAETKAWQLVVGCVGIYGAYLYYGNVQEDLFRYRDADGVGFTFVWFLQVLESAVTIAIGYAGRKVFGGRDNLPLTPFFKSGVSQLAAKALMSMSLAAGLSFPVVVLAKSAKIVPVMIGQLIMGGSSYTFRDYMFVVLIVCGTALLSIGKSSELVPEGSDTLSGLVLIFLSLTADGFTGGLQKKLKRETASMAPTTYDFLYYSHLAQWAAAVVICCVTGQLWTASAYMVANPAVWWCVLASCICSAVGQCFIFYVISCFDPLVCTTITTTRKMLTVILSITFKGHGSVEARSTETATTTATPPNSGSRTAMQI
jgi:UDP-galactose transporter B1